MPGRVRVMYDMKLEGLNLECVPKSLIAICCKILFSKY